MSYPLAWQISDAAPFIVYPELQAMVTVLPRVVPLVAVATPLAIVTVPQSEMAYSRRTYKYLSELCSGS